MNSPDTQLRNVLGRMANEAPEPVPFDDLGVHQLHPIVRSTGWSRRPASVLVIAAVSVLIVGLFSVIVFGPGGGETSPVSPSLDGRTYYESLDLSSPRSAVQTFTDAFAADDFMTVWLAFDAGAQLEVQDHFSMGAYDQLVDYDMLGAVVEGSPFPSLSEWESWDEWWMFDHLMLQADTHNAFLIDLSGSVTVTSENVNGDEAELTANVQGVDGPVTFRLFESASNRWRVNQVTTGGRNPDAVPWSTGGGTAGGAGQIVDLPADHAAAQILATSPTYDEFAELATAENREFVCGAGGATMTWEVCLLLEDGLLAVVPFTNSPGLMGTIESPDLAGPVVVPLEGEAIAVQGIELSVAFTITFQGEEIGSVSGP